MTIGTAITLWSARIAFLLYAAALAAWLARRPGAARLAWTCGFLVYLGHVAAAFQFHHHWSHDAAYEETARQTARLFGVHSGAGLYCNYAFTAVWALDVIRIWRRAETYRWRHWIVVAIHAFMAFLFFNATVIFVSGWVRWVSLVVFAGLAFLRVRQTRVMPPNA